MSVEPLASRPPVAVATLAATLASTPAAVIFVTLAAFTPTPAWPAPPTPDLPGPSAVNGVAARLVGAALLERGSFELARSLSEGVGARVTGSPEAERAVVWAEDAMKRIGLARVHREPVQVRKWVRGPLSLVLRADPALPGNVDQPLAALALGGTVATPADGIEADVVEASSMEELTALGPRALGAIVFINKEMVSDNPAAGYGVVGLLRWKGPPEAARLGALAFVMRSAGTGHHRLPHTGGTEHSEGVRQIPAAALAAEDAELLHRRLATRGKARLLLKLEARELPPAPSFNIVGEVPGGAHKDEIVLIGAHLDSWDVGRGALDDAAGCGIALDSARLIAALRPGPARTIRVVLFMSEELGGAGALGYAEAHKAELPRHVVAFEADFGDGQPRGYKITSSEASLPLVRKWVAPLAALVPDEVGIAAQGGADTRAVQKAGVPVIELAQDPAHYFDWHHTAADTIDKLDPHNLALNTAAFANLTWMLATAPEQLGRNAPVP